MIKLFRNIRKNLLAEGKTSKYLKYAIGEIILVVIGILIAVGINSLYNANQNEKKIKAILIQVQNELITDIKDAKRIFHKNIEGDSLSRQILNNSLSFEEFVENPHRIFFTNRYASFSNKKTGYQRFTQNLESLPEKYQVLTPIFNDLFEEKQNDIDDYNEVFKNFVFQQLDKDFNDNPNEYRSFTEFDSLEVKRTIFSNPYLKNKSVVFMNHLKNLSQAANDYRITSIVLYKKIDSLLGQKPEKHTELLSIIPDKDVYSQFLGQYKNSDGKSDNNIYALELKDEQLAIKNPSGDYVKLYWDSDGYYYLSDASPIFKFSITEQGENIIEVINDMATYRYIKIKDLK